jgi:hypothetical protein
MTLSISAMVCVFMLSAANMFDMPSVIKLNAVMLNAVAPKEDINIGPLGPMSYKNIVVNYCGNFNATFSSVKLLLVIPQ